MTHKYLYVAHNLLTAGFELHGIISTELADCLNQILIRTDALTLQSDEGLSKTVKVRKASAREVGNCIRGRSALAQTP